MASQKQEHKFSNDEILTLLKEVSAAMEVKGVNFFKIRAYQTAISSIEGLTTSVFDLWRQNKLSDIPGLGSSLTQHIEDLFTKGSVNDFEQVKEGLPAGMFELIGLRGIGAKKAFKLAETFSLKSREKAIKRIKEAAENDEISQIEGFGQKSQQQILEAINEKKTHKNKKERMLLSYAEEVAERVVAYLKELECVQKVEVLGSYRRKEATVGDLDIAVATTCPEEVIEHFTNYFEVEDVLAKGDSRAAVVLTTDVQIDLRVVAEDSFGSMLQYFTGSKQHNIVLRTYALEKGLSLSEYGIKANYHIEKFDNEEAFYKKIGLDYIPPELRQGRDEVELASKQNLPNLIELKDIKGDLHTHTTASDGINSVEEMIAKAMDLGYEYIGISDHSPSVNARGRYDVLGVIEERINKIEQINSSQDKVRVLFGYEINILADGSISLPDDLISKLDYSIASIHTAFNQSREEITSRYLTALENPLIDIIGHPSTRLINERGPVDVDWEKIFESAKKHNKILEINSQPSRLDLPEDLVRDAVKDGIKIIVNTDAHSVDTLGFMRYGIHVARRSGLTKDHVVNTLPLEDLLKLLKI